jgi:UDP-glucose 4-epimerase
MEKFLVTGGAGFIGSHIVDGLIARGYQVYVVDNLSTGQRQNINPNAVFPESLDVSQTPNEWLDEDTIAIHCASQPKCNVSLYAPVNDMENNYAVGIRFITKCVSRKIKRLVLISSMSVYGDQEKAPFTEDMKPAPKDPYGIHKYALEQISKSLCENHGVEYLILRPQHVFGIRQRYDLSYRNVIPRWIKKAILGQPLPVFGDLSLKRAFSPISLIQRSIVSAALDGKLNGEIINLGSSKTRSLAEVAEKISKVVNIKVEFEFLPSPSTLLNLSVGSTDKAIMTLKALESETEFDANLSQLADEIKSAAVVEKENGIVPEISPQIYFSIYGA